MKTVINTGTPDYWRRILVAALLGAGEGDVERMEAEGQQSFVNSDVLPNVSGHSRWLSSETDEMLRSLGFELGDLVADDPIWRFASLPKGWERRPSEHSMWSDIVDNFGRRRLQVFYKAAFYDRRCEFYIHTRLEIASGLDPEDGDGGEVAVIMDGFRRLRSFGGRGLTYGERQILHKEALDWLLEYFPDFESPLAYWEASIEELVTIAEGGQPGGVL